MINLFFFFICTCGELLDAGRVGAGQSFETCGCGRSLATRRSRRSRGLRSCDHNWRNFTCRFLSFSFFLEFHATNWKKNKTFVRKNTKRFPDKKKKFLIISLKRMQRIEREKKENYLPTTGAQWACVTGTMTSPCEKADKKTPHTRIYIYRKFCIRKTTNSRQKK